MIVNPTVYLMFFLTWLIFLICNILIWILCIRPYIRKNGRSTGSGANYGLLALADASIADEIRKKNKEYPWFLSLFWIILAVEFGLPICGCVLLYLKQ